MKTTIHQPHDKFFKRNLKDKRVAIDFLKSYVTPQLYKKIDINSLQLTEKSFRIYNAIPIRVTNLNLHS